MNRYANRTAHLRLMWVAVVFALAAALVPAAAQAQGSVDNGIAFVQVSTQQAADEAVVVADGEKGSAAGQVEDEILVTFKDGADADDVVDAIESLAQVDEQATLGALDAEALDAVGGEPLVMKLQEGADVAAAVRAAKRQANVESAQPNYRYRLMEDVNVQQVALATAAVNPDDVLTNDPALSSYDPADEENAWHLNAIDIESAWYQIKCEGTVTVAVLDTGCDMAHEDLADNVLADYAWNAYKNDYLSCDYYGHGTHVAGCIAAVANNETGTAGTSYNAKVLPINVFDEYGSDKWSSTTKALVAAYDYLLAFDEAHPEYNLHVVNMSLGGYDNSSADDVLFQERIAQAKERGIISVCAGGNGDSAGRPITAPSYPSDYEDCLAVTALSKDGYTPTTWCDHNSAKDICAPGEDIYCTVPKYCKMEGNANSWVYEAVSGTSMATPITSGVVALLFAARPDLTVDEAMDAIKLTASDRLQFPSDDWYSDRTPSEYGAGILNAGEAVAYVRQLAPNAVTLSRLGDAADEAFALLDDVATSVDGADVPVTKQWVSQEVHDALASVATRARTVALAGSTYDELVNVRQELADAQAVFLGQLADGSMPLATDQAKQSLRHLARNAGIDMDGIAVSVDGSDVAVGAKWVSAKIAERLSAAIQAAQALSRDDDAGEAAVAALAAELADARSEFLANVTVKAASDSAEPSPQKSSNVVINTPVVTAKVVKKALVAANNPNATTVTLGSKVKKVKAKAFAGTKVKALIVKTKKLKKASVKGCLKGSKVKAVQVKVGKAKANKSFAKKYAKLFVKKVAGKKARVKSS